MFSSFFETTAPVTYSTAPVTYSTAPVTYSTAPVTYILYKHKKHISFPPIVYRQGIPNSPYDVWSMQLALAAGEISYHFGR